MNQSPDPPPTAAADVSDSEQVIQKFESFFNTFCYDALQQAVRDGQRSIMVDFRDLDRFDIELADSLLNRPNDLLACAEEAVRRLDLGEDFVEMKVRLHHLPQTQLINIRDLRSEHLYKLVCVEGLIRRASDVRPEILEATFDCPNCGNLIVIPQNGPNFREPTRCICGRKGKFHKVDQKLTDMQKLDVEEKPDKLTGGEQAKRVEVFLRDDLVDPSMGRKVVPGTEVLVTGVLGEAPVITSHGTPSRRLNIFLDANSLEPTIATFEDLKVEPEAEAEIRRLAASPHIYDLLKASLAPTIYGHEEIKEALTLFLFGGIAKRRNDGTRTRGDLHILLVGDPGSGKSMLLKYTEQLAPKGRYVSGKGTSAAGLTASVMKDEFLKAWVLEAGVLVLANRGIACIDELDKMNKDDRSAMHEAMEQQTVTVSKANIQATLRAEAAILAAANPKLGRFDPYSPVAVQIDLPPTLINRFDLIFPIKDIPDKDKDRRMADHILRLHASEEGHAEAPIKNDLLRKYIAFAKGVTPVLSESAILEIQGFFVEMRGKYNMAEKSPSVPISVRQLESLIRLAEASARVRLSETADAEDARRAIKLVFSYLTQVGYDPETKTFDIDRASGVLPAAKRNKLANLLHVIRALAEKEGPEVLLDRVFRELVGEASGEEADKLFLEAEKAVELLKEKGDLFEPSKGYIQLV